MTETTYEILNKIIMTAFISVSIVYPAIYITFWLLEDFICN